MLENWRSNGASKYDHTAKKRPITKRLNLCDRPMKAISFGQELLPQTAEEKGILTVYQLFGTLGMMVMSMEIE